MHLQITLFLREGDGWQHRPLHLQILALLQHENVANAAVFRACAGFIHHSRVKTASLVEGGGKEPLLLTFVAEEEHVRRLMPRLCEMLGPERLVVSQPVSVHNGDGA